MDQTTWCWWKDLRRRLQSA